MPPPRVYYAACKDVLGISQSILVLEVQPQQATEAQPFTVRINGGSNLAKLTGPSTLFPEGGIHLYLLKGVAESDGIRAQSAAARLCGLIQKPWQWQRGVVRYCALEGL